jgi:hypothetical protein
VKLGKKYVLGKLNSHWLGTILFPLPAFCSFDWPSILKLSYSTDTVFHSYHFSIHLNQFSHPDDGSRMFLRNGGTFNHYTVQKPNKMP